MIFILSETKVGWLEFSTISILKTMDDLALNTAKNDIFSTFLVMGIIQLTLYGPLVDL